MATRRRKTTKLNPKLAAAADGIGHTIGHVANQLAKLKRGALAEAAVIRKAVSKDTKKLSKVSAAARRRLSAAAKKRRTPKRARASST